MTYSMQSAYFRQSQLSIDTTGQLAQKYFDEDEFEDNVLDHGDSSGLDLSPPMIGSRRESFVIGSSLFSPKQEDWSLAPDMQHMASTNPFSTNPFLSQHQSTSVSHPGSWPMSTSTSAHSGVATPLHYDGLPSEFEAASSSMFSRTPMPPASFGPGVNGLFAAPPPPVAAATPQSVTMVPSASMQSVVGVSGSGMGNLNGMASIGAMGGMGAMASVMGAHGMKKPQSPTIRTHPELRRGDGIRKKNARFEIPAERNLNNIDMLIAQSTDEQEIKELKQQKRLLRNRQAALDSRQRKKQHTERLEDEKKHYTGVMADMEGAMDRLKLQVGELQRENAACMGYIESLNNEKDEMLRHHTNETGDLRKKINLLTAHIQALESSAASAMSGNGSAYATATGNGYGDMDGLSMGGAWEHVSLFPDMDAQQQHMQHAHHHHQQQQQHIDVKQEPPMQQLVPHKPEAPAAVASASKPAQSGLLFMLFLVGAFVMSSRQTPSIPRVPEDVRVASRALLNDVLKDAGVPAAPGPSSTVSGAVSAATATVSASVTNDLTGDVEPSTVSGVAGVTSPGAGESILGQLSDQLMQPSEQQTADQLFSLSAAQYSNVVHFESMSGQQQQQQQMHSNHGRRTLAEALASMNVNTKADVVTRSLLWNQIPSDVVHDFARMVAESQAVGNGEN